MKKIMFFLLLLGFSLPFVAFGQQNCNLRIAGDFQTPSCSGGMDGAIHVQTTGGAGPYTYIWSSGQTTKDIAKLTSGEYTLTVRDSNGCTAKSKFTLKDKTSDLKLKVGQKSVAGNQYVLQVTFDDGKKPHAITIKKMSDGIRAAQEEYRGQGLPKGLYLLEAFTEAGCSVMQKVTIGANESSIR